MITSSPFGYLLKTLVLFTVVLFCSSCVSTNLEPSGEVFVSGELVRGESQEPFVAPQAPWELWEPVAATDLSWHQASSLEAEGKLMDALRTYSQEERPYRASGNNNQGIPEGLLARKLGLLLKLGKSYEALSQISNFALDRGLSYANLPPKIVLIAAYGYRHQGDVDQSLAWYKLALKADRQQGEVSSIARSSLNQIVREIPLSQYEQKLARWSSDPVIGPFLVSEKDRRDRGGQVVFLQDSKWFSPQTYSPGASLLAESSTLSEEQQNALVSSGNVFTIGVLLPLSGRFASHAQRVRQGIELAVQDFGGDGSVKLVFGDTQGDPGIAAIEYQKMAAAEGAGVVLGPLLFRTSERVAELSREMGTPLISFTKRQGIPGLSGSMYRLGATSDNQVVELVEYAMKTLGLRRFASLYPAHAMGSEFVDAFRREVSNRGGVVLAEGAYQDGDAESMVLAVETLASTQPQAIFLPDSIDRTVPILEKIQQTDLAGTILLGPAQWDDPVAIRGFGGLIEGAVYVTPFFPLSSNASVYRFVKNYKTKFKSEPELLSAQAYDATALVISKVVRGVGVTWSRNGIRDALNQPSSYRGVTGSLNVTKDGEISRRMSVLRLKDGEVVEVMSAGVPPLTSESGIIRSVEDVSS